MSICLYLERKCQANPTVFTNNNQKTKIRMMIVAPTNRKPIFGSS